MFYQLMNILGAILVLIGFGALQMGKLDRRDRWFNLLNLVGSLLLGAVAVVGALLRDRLPLPPSRPSG